MMAECGHCKTRRKAGKGPCKDHIQYEGDMVGKVGSGSSGVVSAIKARHKKNDDMYKHSKTRYKGEE